MFHVPSSAVGKEGGVWSPQGNHCYEKPSPYYAIRCRNLGICATEWHSCNQSASSGSTILTNRVRSWVRHNSNGKLRYSWAIHLDTRMQGQTDRQVVAPPGLYHRFGPPQVDCTSCDSLSLSAPSFPPVIPGAVNDLSYLSNSLGPHQYSLEEIVAEKLRALLQQAEMFGRRGWSRSRARDYYDLWRILGTYRDQMNLVSFDSLLREKCAVRAVSFAGPDEFFHNRMLAFVEETWEQSLGPLVPDLPIFETDISELRPQVAQMVHPGGA